jgi:hypothetical protein
MLAKGAITCDPAQGSVFNSDRFYAYSRALPAYLNGYPAAASAAWQNPMCELAGAPKNDFRWFFYPLWYRNLDHLYNCSPMAPTDEQLLLVEAVKAWNMGHQPGGPGVDQVYRAEQPAYGKAVSTIAQIMAGIPHVPGDQKPALPGDLTIFNGAVVPPTPPGPRRTVTLRLHAAQVAAATAPLERIASVGAGASRATSAGSVLAVGAVGLAGLALVRPALFSSILRSIGLRL